MMEPHATIAAWDGDKLTVYTPTGGIANCHWVELGRRDGVWRLHAYNAGMTG